MKKPLYKSILFWSVIVLCAAAGAMLLTAKLGRTIDQKISSSAASSTPEQIVNNADEGYALTVPHGWYLEENATDTVVVYPDYSPENFPSSPASSSSPTCKIEMSVFPFSSTTAIADWISHRLSADPTVDIKELSSENISIGATAAIKWSGTMDDMPTTLVYAFNDTHAYEIAPSVIGELSQDAPQCDDDLDLFLKKLTL